MRQPLRVIVIVIAALLPGAGRASAQSASYDFEDGTDQGWGHKFTNDGTSEEFPVSNLAGSSWMRVLRNGDFQEAERTVSNPADPLYQTLLAASANESGYEISYDWYVDTATFGGGNFLQLGTYVNTGSGYYAQNFPATGKEVELNGTQMNSGQAYFGTVTQTFAQKGFDLPEGQTFFRIGLIINGDGPNQAVYFDNITVRPIPEPASLSLLGLALPALALRRRRRG